MKFRLAALVFCTLQLSPVVAQNGGSWAPLAVSAGPLGRQRHAMAYDVARNETVLFGGSNGAFMNDTWVLTATGWVQRAPATTPAPRADHALAYDPVRQRVVLFGGTNGSELTDVWEWDGANWSLRSNSVFGVGSSGSAAYDPLLGGVFFNRASVNLLWNGTSATVLTVPQPIGGNNAIAFSAVEAGCMQVVGQRTRVFRLPQGWQELSVSTAFNLIRYAIASDPVSNRVLFQGGDGSIGGLSGSGVGHTWQWTGSIWSLVAGQDPELPRHAMVFDHGRGCFLLFGSTAVTYRWVDDSPDAAYEAYGAGCAGTLPATPRLAADPLWNSGPVLGGAFFARVDQLPPAVFVGGVIGYSDATWSGVPLPFALDSFGMAGCNLLARPDAMPALGLSNATGAASWVTTIPANPVLGGLLFYQQAFALVPGANALGVVWSNGGRGTVGY